MLNDLAAIQDGIRGGRFTNEASVSTGIVLRLLNALAWPVYNPEIVYPEYPLNGRRADFALCSAQKEPLIFIEVKQVGQIQKGDQQLFEYAYMKGVPMAILTDGREWHFYLPGERGNFFERRVYLLDLLERDIDECAERFQRYLNYHAVRSGAALEAARTDHRDAAKERLVQATLPEAWEKLVEEKDELLVELIGDKVESLCGYKPTISAVVSFLTRQVLPGIHRASMPTPQASAERRVAQTPALLPAPRSTMPTRPNQTQEAQTQPAYGYALQGQEYVATSARDVMVQIFGHFTLRDSSFPERFAALYQGRTRCYVARVRGDLNPTRLDLVQKDSREFSPGWWVDVNLSVEMIEKLIRKACEVAGIRYGSELRVYLPNPQQRQPS